jgi:hypothetical protein
MDQYCLGSGCHTGLHGSTGPATRLDQNKCDTVDIMMTTKSTQGQEIVCYEGHDTAFHGVRPGFGIEEDRVG